MTPGSLGPGLADETGTSVLICPVRLLSVRGGGGVHTSGERAGSKPVQPTGIGQGGSHRQRGFHGNLGWGALLSSLLFGTCWASRKEFQGPWGFIRRLVPPPCHPRLHAGGPGRAWGRRAPSLLPGSCLLGTPFSHLSHDNRVHWETVAAAAALGACSCLGVTPLPCVG